MSLNAGASSLPDCLYSIIPAARDPVLNFLQTTGSYAFELNLNEMNASDLYAAFSFLNKRGLEVQAVTFGDIKDLVLWLVRPIPFENKGESLRDITDQTKQTLEEFQSSEIGQKFVSFFGIDKISCGC